MGRPDPIEYAERLYDAIRIANFSPLSFLAFGNAVKDGIALRNMPRIAAEPFMRVVGEMVGLDGQTEAQIVDAETTSDGPSTAPASLDTPPHVPEIDRAAEIVSAAVPQAEPAAGTERR